MSHLNPRKTTKREFLKLFGLSSASLLALGTLADELLAEVQRGISVAKIPVAAMIRPNALKLGRSQHFTATIVFPGGYKATDVDVSSVTCEGACALDSALHPDGRTIVVLYDSGGLRKDLPCGSSVRFNVTGRLSDGSIFEGSDKVAIVTGQSVVYHTSSRRQRSCNACKAHAANRIYSSRQAADGDRPHFGCNCRIVEEMISWQNYLKAFWPGSKGSTAVYDRRWGWPPTSPPEIKLEYPSVFKEHLRGG